MGLKHPVNLLRPPIWAILMGPDTCNTQHGVEPGFELMVTPGLD